MPARLHAPALGYARNRVSCIRIMNDALPGLVHRDCHPGNVFWKGTRPGLVDWQLARAGPIAGDLAYCLATGLSIADRRRHERTLLDLYREELSRRSVDYRSPQLWRDYRRHLAYAFEAMVITAGIGTMMDPSVNATLVDRCSAAVADHDTFTDHTLWRA